MAPSDMDRKSFVEAIQRVLDGHRNDYEIIYKACDPSPEELYSIHKSRSSGHF